MTGVDREERIDELFATLPWTLGDSEKAEVRRILRALIEFLIAGGVVSGETGQVDFNINVHVDMMEFGEWRPERITAFFRGIAEVLFASS